VAILPVETQNQLLGGQLTARL